MASNCLRLRPRLFIPPPDRRYEWWETGTFKKYGHKQVRKFAHKLPSHYTIEDAEQDSCMYFYLACQRYYWVVAQPHMMSLYGWYFYHRLLNLSYVGDRDKLQASYSLKEKFLGDLYGRVDRDGDAHDGDLVDKIPDVEDKAAALSLAISELPSELYNLLKILLTDCTRVTEPRRKRERPGLLPIRETRNETFCRLLGLDPSTHNLSGQLRAFLKGQMEAC